MPHNEGNIRINGGEHLYFKTDGSWQDFGIVNKGYEISDDRAVTDIQTAGGFVTTVVQQRTIKLILEMAETDKTHLDMVDTLSGKSGELYIYDGIVNNKHIALYVKSALIIVSVKKKDGDSPQVIQVTCTFKRQNNIVSVTDTGLPSSGPPIPPTGTYVGQNRFYAWIEWPVT